MKPVKTKGNILVVDGDANTRDSISSELAKGGYSVCVASNRNEIMKVFKQGSIELVLLEWDLLDSKETDVVRQIEEIKSENAIVILTANASLDIAIKAIRAAVDDFLIKPVDTNYLKEVIERCLTKARSLRNEKRLISELRKANERLSRRLRVELKKYR